VVECQLCKCEALSTSPSLTKSKKITTNAVYQKSQSTLYTSMELSQFMLINGFKGQATHSTLGFT
jgi:glucokinase